ncbi:ISL3 family transposase [Actinomadura gamaensis]|uniref:ISL3 family transposase n=1 Tax=Actinomadura gamaensis TaxID=1763541 RepID=A0ABV9UBM3_9ACTN
MLEVDALVGAVFSGLSALFVEGVVDEGECIRVAARTRGDPVPCPVCGTPTRQVHGWCGRTVTDVPVDGRRVIVGVRVRVRVRRLRCGRWNCPRGTFREQVPGLLERYQRRTSRLAEQLGAMVREPAGRASARLSAGWALSRSVALRLLARLPLPPLRVPRVLGVDDFALKGRQRYATILISAGTSEPVDVLPCRGAEALQEWLGTHPGVEVVCRDGSPVYAEAIRQALPDAVQVGDRWDLWLSLCDKALSEVRSHTACWATVNPPRPAGDREQTTRERWQQVHALLDQGVGLLECARRLNISLGTVNATRAAANPKSSGSHRATGPPSSTPTATTCAPVAPKTPPFRSPSFLKEIKQLGYTGSLNLLYRYLNQGRAEGDRPVTTPRHLARLLLSQPEHRRDKDNALLYDLTASCPELTELARLISGFAQLLTPAEGNDTKLTTWITDVRGADLPYLHGFVNGIDLDRAAIDAALTLPFHNGRTEGVNTRTKRIMRQMHGRASFDLLRHRILLECASRSATTDYGTEPKTVQSPAGWSRSGLLRQLVRQVAPRPRGWSPAPGRSSHGTRVVPAPAGIADLDGVPSTAWPPSSPAPMRGDCTVFGSVVLSVVTEGGATAGGCGGAGDGSLPGHTSVS